MVGESDEMEAVQPSENLSAEFDQLLLRLCLSFGDRSYSQGRRAQARDKARGLSLINIIILW